MEKEYILISMEENKRNFLKENNITNPTKVDEQNFEIYFKESVRETSLKYLGTDILIDDERLGIYFEIKNPK